jgi:hypothetical protein
MAEATVTQQRAEQLLNALWGDKEIGGKIRTTAKQLFPDVPIPEETLSPFIQPIVEEGEKLKKELADLRAERAAEKQEREDRAAKRKLEDALNSARDKYALTPEGFDAMVQRMKETGNYSDAEAAAAWVASKAPPAEVKGPTWAPEALNLFGSQSADENMAMLHRDPQRYMDNQLNEFVRDPDKYVRDTLGR